jgi:hypothetical protein
MIYPDPYSECENALRAVLLEITEYFPNEWQVSNNDTNIARGGDQFVILRPGQFPLFQQTNTGQIKDYDWNVVTELYIRYTEYEESWNRFKEVRAAVLWKVNINPLMVCVADPSKSATNVWGTSLATEENAQYFSFADSPEEATPNFIIQTMFTTIRQRVEYPF